jgi:hypothetical protein
MFAVAGVADQDENLLAVRLFTFHYLKQFQSDFPREFVQEFFSEEDKHKIKVFDELNLSRIINFDWEQSILLRKERTSCRFLKHTRYWLFLSIRVFLFVIWQVSFQIC